MSWLRRFLPVKSKFIFNGNTRQLQEEVDLHRLYLVLEYHRRTQTGEWSGRADAPWALGEEAALLDLDELRSRVETNIVSQVGNMVSYGNGISRHGSSGKRLPCEFSLVVRASQVAGAGNGVWMQGKAEVGQVVALFPGLLYKSTEIRDIPDYPNFGSGSDFLMSWYDGCVLDSRAWTSFCKGTIHEYNAKRKRTHSANGTYLVDREWFTVESKHNNYALGHMVNHPPKGVSPNVLPAPLRWKISQREISDKIVPWQTFSGEQSEDDIRGFVLVAMNNIDNEELYVNYRLNPNVLGGLPKWYHPVNDMEDVRRWK